MKKILFIFYFTLYTLNAHECSYKLELDLDFKNNLIRGDTTIQSDHPIIKLLDTKANITNIKNASLGVESGSPQLKVQNIDKATELSFTYKFRPINGDLILLDNWYPKIDIMCKYETIVLNSDIKTIVEATKTIQKNDKTIFIFDKPIDSIHLVASKNYIQNSKITDLDMNISTYFYQNDSYLSDRYLKKTQEYFKLYKNMFGFLPFNNFSIIETPFPAGYSMPTYTLIGQQIIDKDFVINNSLGHEIVHQWFGNYVYSPNQGNWAEGMATFYSDYLYAKQDNKDIDYRKNMLIKYNSYVNSKNEIALIEFRSKAKESKNAIGYSKATFFFYMLEKKIGAKAFDDGVKILLKEYPFKVASYKNLREIFEKTSKMKLLSFFKNWVYKKGALDVKLNNIDLKYIENKYVLSFNIINNIQNGNLPISICSDEECLDTKIDLSQNNQTIKLDMEPNSIVVDKNYEFFRKLSTAETPPVISKILDGNAIIVFDKTQENKFSKMRHIYKNFKYADEITYEELKNNNIFILGSKNKLLHRIAINFKMQGDAKIELFKNPLNNKKVVAVFDMKKLSRSIFYRLKHLGKYSTVVFQNNKIISKVTKPSVDGIVYNINNGSYAFKPKAQKLNGLIKDIAKHKVVFIGEKHTEFSSHLNQLKIIKEMYKKNKKLSIAMEMFQKPYQKYLDAFIAGNITEKEMIIKTEYFKRWKYDYELYRPIILFAKEKNIPIVAINIDRDITKTIVTQGIDKLIKEQQAQIPDSIDFSATKYKKQLKIIYAMHQSKKFKSFDEFYHAQLIWDESMAANLVKYMKDHKDRSVAVLAGNGHLMYGYGIPDRVKRRGITEYTIVLNIKNPDPDIADYILYPSSIGTIKAKKIGVFLKGDKKLEVKSVLENSLAQKADIKVGDIITAINDIKITSLHELKTELAFANNSVKLTILRDDKKIDVGIDF